MSAARVDGRQLRWEQHKADRRKLIIDAALDILDERQPGEEIHVQEIADRAGLNRTAIHRLFKDRNDLDLEVQWEICRRMSHVFLSAVDLNAKPREIIRGVVGDFVRYAVDHLAWVRFVERGVPGSDVRPRDETIAGVVEQIEQVIAAVADSMDVDLSDNDRAMLEPWVTALVGGGLDAVQRWTSRGERRPDTETFVEGITEMAFLVIDGLAAQRGLPLPETSIADLLSAYGQRE